MVDRLQLSHSECELLLFVAHFGCEGCEASNGRLAGSSTVNRLFNEGFVAFRYNRHSGPFVKITSKGAAYLASLLPQVTHVRVTWGEPECCDGNVKIGGTMGGEAIPASELNWDAVQRRGDARERLAKRAAELQIRSDQHVHDGMVTQRMAALITGLVNWLPPAFYEQAPCASMLAKHFEDLL